jgi:hypothetical protein
MTDGISIIVICQQRLLGSYNKMQQVDVLHLTVSGFIKWLGKRVRALWLARNYWATL